MNPQHPNYLQHVHHWVREGELPKHAYPRLVYFGHTVVQALLHTPSTTTRLCIACGFEWTGQEDNCPQCHRSEVFGIHYSRQALWRCRTCSYEWVSEYGEYCANCGDCFHRWVQIKCILCRKPRPLPPLKLQTQRRV